MLRCVNCAPHVQRAKTVAAFQSNVSYTLHHTCSFTVPRMGVSMIMSKLLASFSMEATHKLLMVYDQTVFDTLSLPSQALQQDDAVNFKRVFCLF